jgi:hypothetical protein
MPTINVTVYDSTENKRVPVELPAPHKKNNTPPPNAHSQSTAGNGATGARMPAPAIGLNPSR